MVAFTVGMVIVQGCTAIVVGGRITVVTGLLLMPVALYMVLFVARNATALRTRACGTCFARAVTT